MDSKQFAETVKQKYPQYASVPDDQLTQAMVKKYPQYAKVVNPTAGVGGAMTNPQQAQMPQAPQRQPQQQQQPSRPAGQMPINQPPMNQMDPSAMLQSYAKADPQGAQQLLQKLMGAKFGGPNVEDDYKKALTQQALATAEKDLRPPRQAPEYIPDGESPSGTGLVLDKFSGKVTDTGTKMAAKKDPAINAFKEDTRQDRLEKTYSDRVSKVVASRTGQLGLQDAKVNQAVHLRTLSNQYFNPQTKSYDIPEAQAGEMVVGLANLVSGGNIANLETLRQVTPKTASGDVNHLIAYWTGKPITYNTQAMYKNLVDSIDRQGGAAEKLRDKYQAGLRSLRPKGLDPETAAEIEKTQFTTSYGDFVNQSPDKSTGGGGLTPEEQSEFQRLDAKYGKK